ncbi:hypothetical protein COH20_005024 [Aspergillus flavus]|nr:hypothetical protein AFLA_011702 [Aspergillus flavus NRRL3357]KAJ1717764.1 hypothetical protein NYO67_146 [Aspergillus flavus]RAQ73590.1 hypothetical protein COH20_005024 [Aspergillus flavus]RAQ74548.1 hypothetical protein COH21_003656 [Aspergillus flavus]
MTQHLSDITTCHPTGAKHPVYDSPSDREPDRPIKKRQIRGRTMLKSGDCRRKKIKGDNRSIYQSCPSNRRGCCKKTVGVCRRRTTRGPCPSTVLTESEGQKSDRTTKEELSKRLDRLERRLHFMFPELFPDPDRDEVTLIDSGDDSVTVCSENDSYPVACKAAAIVNRWLAQSANFSDKIPIQPNLALAQNCLAEVTDTCSVGDIAPSFQASASPLSSPLSSGGDDRNQRRHHDRNAIAEGPFWRLPRP